MTGINYFSAMMITSEIGNIARLSISRKIILWAGICPLIHQSGNLLYGKNERR
jgi:transposase